MQTKSSSHQTGAFNTSKLLFSAVLDVDSHVIKKNGREIQYRFGKGNNYTSRGHRFTPYLGKTDEQKSAEDILVLLLRERAGHIQLVEPIADDMWALFKFQFPDERYYTNGKRGKRRRQMTLPDLSNLYEGPQDALQTAGIITNDTLICCHDLSCRIPGDRYRLHISLFPFEESPTWKHQKSLSSV